MYEKKREREREKYHDKEERSFCDRGVISRLGSMDEPSAGDAIDWKQNRSGSH